MTSMMCKWGLALLLAGSAVFWVMEPPGSQDLAVGTWIAVIDSPDGMSVEVPLDVSADGQGYSGVMRVPERGDIPVEDLALRGGQLTFAWRPGVRLSCTLDRREDASYAGTCADALGNSGRIQMLPPGITPPTAPTADIGPLAPGDVMLGENEYVEFTVGALPLILSSPHGGALKPDSIPDRTRGYGVEDSDTQELTRLIASALQEVTGRGPHVVISRLHRSKLDPNRAVDEAANGNPDSEGAWREYHGFIESARQAVEDTWGRGLYLDIHGHGHRTPWVELGYGLMSSDLNGDSDLDPMSFTMRALADATSTPIAELVRGPASLGALLEQRGYRSVPSPGDPGPGSADYFNGGYSSVRHGSLQAGSIDSIQVEHPKRGVREPESDRQAYARVFAEVLVEYLEQHYGFELVER